MLKHATKGKPLLEERIHSLIQDLKVNPEQGTPMAKSCHKIRLAIPGRGKSGGARVITLVQIVKETVVLLAIYSKNEISNISDAFLNQLIQEAFDME